MKIDIKTLRQRAKLSFALMVTGAAMFAGSPVLHASAADNRIESSFKDTYVYRTYLRDDTVKIKAKNGVVTLTGTVAGQVHRALAQETATGLPGVTRVDNKLDTRAEVAAENADEWITYKVKAALLFHRNVNAHKTDVEVKDGMVKLKGEASSEAQKELTTEYAGDIEGVKGVKNEMRVISNSLPLAQAVETNVDDVSITAQVRIALLTHRSTSNVKTAVSTHQGEVTLSGSARNESEKLLVNKLVSDIIGVRSVKNQMTVETAKGK